MSKTIPGIVDSLNGLLIKSNASGQLSIAKNGTQVMKGEQLFLLSGDALLHAIELGDIKLAVNTPFNLDGISPLLKNISQSSQEDIENLLQKAVDNGIDPVALLETLEATAAGEGPVLGSGGSIFVYEPSYGIGSVAAGFDTFSANTQEPNGTEIPNILLPPGQKAILAEVDAAAGNITPITGINGVPQVGGVATAAVTEDANVINANLASGGTLTINDVDAGQSSFTAQPSVAGTYGTFTLAADGVWTYTANNAQTAIQQLGAGQTLTDSFTATSADGSASQTVTVTIIGTNDIPEIGGVATAVVTEDVNVANNNLSSGGTLTIADVDAGQSSFIAQPSVAGTYGTFTLAANGVWTYTANNAQTAIQQLGAGQTLTDSFTATSADGSATQLVTVTIQGTNDVPVIAGVSTGTVTEDANVINANLSSGGTLTIADVDAGQSSFIAQPSVAGTYGTFTLAANGVWTYTANNAQTAIQQLGAGQTLTDSFTATSADGSASQTVTVTIQGTNDVPVIAGVSTGTVTEDVNVANNNLSSGGTLTISDVDAGQSSFIAQPSVAGTYGTFTLAADGVWTYTANNGQTAIQQLGAGQTLTDSFTATSADGSASQTVTVTITGTNDIPEIGGVATAVVTEDVNVANNNLSSGGTLTIADVDAGQSSFIAQPSVAGTYGTFTLAANGVWTYTANNAQTAIQHLGAGQTLTDSFTATSADGTATQLVTVTIQGTNDVPVIAGVSTGTVTEDVNVTSGNLTSSGTLTIADVDAGQSSFIAQPSVAGTYGTFTLAANGAWTYTANNAQTAIQQLKVGQSLTDSFTAKSFDGTASKVVTVTIQGTNEVPILTNDTKTGNEDTIITGNVLSNDQDADGGVLTVTAFSINNTSYAAGATATIAGVGTLSIGANGAYSFTPVANWSGSAPSVTYTVSDGQGGSATASLQLNVTAVADVPTLGLTTPTSSIPIGTGLIKETWINNILGLTTNGAGATPSTLQAVIEATLLNPSSTTSIQNVQQPGTNDVATGTASKISGLIYLEAGHTYTFSGSGDDSIRIVVGNNVVAQATWGGSQGVFSGNFVPTTTGYYLLSIYHNNSDGPGNYDVNLRDNGGAIKDLSSANFKLYQDVDDVHGVNLRLSELKPDGFYQAYSYNEGSEDTSIPLSRINAALVDTDGSEILAIKLGNIPVGAVLSDGTHTFTSTVGNTSVDITGWNINALTILPPLNFNGNFSMQVTATATETSNGAQESSTVNINVTVYPVDDVPVANIADGITQNIAGAQIDGVLADMGGESQGGVINLNGTPLEGLTSGRVDITYNISGSTITAMAGSNVVFVLSADGPDGTYNFTLLQPLDPINIAYTPTVSGSGNASAYYVNSASGALSASAGDWEMKITASGGNGNVILNSNGLGVTGGAGNTVVNRGEKLTFDFDNTGLDGVANNATGMTLDLIATGSVDVSYKWTAYYTDGTTATGTAILPDGTTASIDIPVTANKYLDRVELENNSSSSSANNKHFRVSGVEFDIEGDKTTDLPFQFTATDGDGDSISGNFTVTVTSDPLNLNLFDFSNEHEKVLSNNSENLLIPEDLSHMGTVAGGHGIDTVKFNENNMGLSTNEIKEHFGHGGWEVIDMAGAGKNDVHLDLDAALKLAHNSDLSVEVNGVTYDHVLKIRGDGDGQQHDTVNIEKTSTQTWNELGNVDAAHGGGKLFEFSNGAEVAHVQVVGVTPTAALPEIPPPTTVA